MLKFKAVNLTWLNWINKRLFLNNKSWILPPIVTRLLSKETDTLKFWSTCKTDYNSSRETFWLPFKAKEVTIKILETWFNSLSMTETLIVKPKQTPQPLPQWELRLLIVTTLFHLWLLNRLLSEAPIDLVNKNLRVLFLKLENLIVSF